MCAGTYGNLCLQEWENRVFMEIQMVVVSRAIRLQVSAEIASTVYNLA